MRYMVFIVFFLAFMGPLSLDNSTSFINSAEASDKKASRDRVGRHPQSGCYRRDGEHRCERNNNRGGYSYRYEDSIIQDEAVKRQAGPFDSGFFFDTSSDQSQYLNN